MCARFTIRTAADLLAERFGLVQVPDLRPRYNLSPAQAIPVIGAKAGGQGRGLALFRWGFLPHRAVDDSRPKPVNAKSGTVAPSARFGDSLRNRRCLVPADGFYEWVRRESCGCDCLTVGDQTCRPIGSTLRGRRPGNGPSKSPRTMYPSAARPPHRPRGACGPASTMAGGG
jgi:hypothetical protein